MNSSQVLAHQLEGINDRLIRPLVSAGITGLTPVQLACLPHCLAGEDVLAKAKTGTGKTLAFLIPTVQRLIAGTRAPIPVDGVDSVDPVRAIVLSSTRELAAQIESQAKMLTAQLEHFNIEIVLGGSSITPQRERLDPKSVPSGEFRYGGIVDLMIATPGRLTEHVETTPGFEARLGGLETLILDEVDQLLDGGFQRNIEALISKLPKQRQSLCFSATVPDRLLKVLNVALRSGHAVVDCVGEEVDTHAAIEQFYMFHSLEESMLALYDAIWAEVGRRPEDYKILAFLPTARQTQFSTAVLKKMGLNLMEIHSRIKQNERTSVSDRFRAGNQMILLSSDVSARGVDYPDVTLVVQVGAPSTREVYIQRLGRTGRSGKSGSGLLLLCDFEKQFLEQLKGLPIREAARGVASESDVARVRDMSREVDDDLAAQTYRAWIMANNGMRKLYKWTKQLMVNNADLYARAVLGRESTPLLQRDLVIQLGLQGLDGLNIVETLPSADSEPCLAGLVAPEEEEKVVVKINRFDLNAGLRKDGKAAAEAIMALSAADALALQAKLEADGEAMVASFKILSAWVTVSRETSAPPATKMEPADAKAAPDAAVSGFKITFPLAGSVEGVKSAARPVIEFKNVCFDASASDSKEASGSCPGFTGTLTLSSRVGVHGSGSSGSLLMSALSRHRPLLENEGEISCHCGLRMAHVRDLDRHGKHQESTLMNYISWRFQKGYDEELQQLLLASASPSSPCDERREALEVLSRRPQGNSFMYEVRWESRDENERSWESAAALRKMGLSGLILACDERSVSNQRPLTRREIVKHCEAFGVDAASCCDKKLGSFSPNLRGLASLAAAFWTKPHLVILEELSASLDADALAGVEEAVKNFKGGVLLLDSARKFVENVCHQTWNLEGGSLRVEDMVKAK